MFAFVAEALDSEANSLGLFSSMELAFRFCERLGPIQKTHKILKAYHYSKQEYVDRIHIFYVDGSHRWIRRVSVRIFLDAEKHSP